MADCALVHVPYVWLNEPAGAVRDYPRGPKYLNETYLSQCGSQLIAL